ncbi:MAG: hypothetical protein ACI9HB_002750, partial [Gammaproteobacteria bacterium]
LALPPGIRHDCGRSHFIAPTPNGIPAYFVKNKKPSKADILPIRMDRVFHKLPVFIFAIVAIIMHKNRNAFD